MMLMSVFGVLAVGDRKIALAGHGPKANDFYGYGYSAFGIRSPSHRCTIGEQLS
jgi:hypothetical protein